MRLVAEKDVESLLLPDARAQLSSLHLLRLYLDPGALFKDASRGTALSQSLALSYNRRMRWMLLSYLRRWTMIAASFFIGIFPAEAVSLLTAAALAIGCSISVVVVGVTAVAYFFLGGVSD